MRYLECALDRMMRLWSSTLCKLIAVQDTGKRVPAVKASCSRLCVSRHIYMPGIDF